MDNEHKVLPVVGESIPIEWFTFSFDLNIVYIICALLMSCVHTHNVIDTAIHNLFDSHSEDCAQQTYYYHHGLNIFKQYTYEIRTTTLHTAFRF